MPASIHRELKGLTNTRDLRAEILGLATQLIDRSTVGKLMVDAPVISVATVRDEWRRHLRSLRPDLRRRMTLDVTPATTAGAHDLALTDGDRIPLGRPNYRHEVLRLILSEWFDREDRARRRVTQKELSESLGLSLTPVRNALAVFRDVGLIESLSRTELRPDALSQELISRIGAQTTVLRFRFRRGAQLRTPVDLLKRVRTIMSSARSVAWKSMALSGVTAAQMQVPDLDLLGTPRVDLVVGIPRQSRQFDTTALRLLDDGLEWEPNVLAPAPVAISLIRAATPTFVTHRGRNGESTRYAQPADVFLSLLEQGLRIQALQYARAMGR